MSALADAQDRVNARIVSLLGDQAAAGVLRESPELFLGTPVDYRDVREYVNLVTVDCLETIRASEPDLLGSILAGAIHSALLTGLLCQEVK